MKRFNLIFRALLILIAKLQGQWEVVNEVGAGGFYNTIDFIDENTGWLGGLPGNILKTEDGGETWFALPFDQGLNIAQFDFINDSVGWAIANRYDYINDEDGIILKTADGGKSWSLQKKAEYGHYLNSIYAVNDTVVYTAGDSIIIKTSDGGTFWLDISPLDIKTSYQSIHFLNTETGFVTAEFYDSEHGRWYAYILRTSDGGATWHKWTLPDAQSPQDLQFINNTTGYFVCLNDSGTGSLMYETKDIGTSWMLKFKSRFRISSLLFTDANTAYAVQNDSSYFQAFMHSTDGGIIWKKISTISKSGDYKIYVLNDHSWFLYGIYRCGGILLRSTDQGNHWIIQKLSGSFDKVFFLDRNTGFVAGGQLPDIHIDGWGYLFKTEDGCKTWSFNFETESTLPSLFFVNRSVGFIIVPNVVFNFSLGPPSLYKTNDGGNNWSCTWSCDIDSLRDRANDVWFLNEQRGWLVGSQSYATQAYVNAAIFETSDGGKIWQTVWQHPDTSQHCTSLHSIYVVNENLGWAIGESGCIVKYSQETGWENQPTLSDLPLNCVFFTDEQNGWITGGYMCENDFHTIFLKTEDGGKTWQEMNLSFLVLDIYFQDRQHGWVIGSNRSDNGVILETTDGGDHWAVADNRFSDLASMHYCDNYLWAVGSSGLILRTAVDTSVGIDKQETNSFPRNNQLFQNYPNPFNPKTVICYSLNVTCHAELSIYNILGQKVATLVEKEQPAGNYTVEWNAAGFSSGLYFYRLVTDQGFTNTKKLLVLK